MTVAAVADVGRMLGRARAVRRTAMRCRVRSVIWGVARSSGHSTRTVRHPIQCLPGAVRGAVLPRPVGADQFRVRRVTVVHLGGERLGREEAEAHRQARGDQPAQDEKAERTHELNAAGQDGTGFLKAAQPRGDA